MRRRGSSFKTIALLMLLPIAGLALFLAVQFVRSGIDDARASRAADTTTAKATQPPVLAGTIPPAAPHPSPEPAPSVESKPIEQPKQATTHDDGRRGDIVLILDDVGFDHQPLEQAMTIDPNLNFSILPNAQRAGEFAARLNQHGFEILCHLPMEPTDPREKPGAGAVLTSMSDAEVARTTRAAFDAVPYARGMNNHMGSRATTDRRVMNDVMHALPKGAYFIDSRTIGGSVAETVARENNVRTAARNVFLDNVQSEPAIRKQLDELAKDAAQHGVAVGIGHIYPVTVKVLNEEIPNLRTRGFRLLRASEAVR